MCRCNLIFLSTCSLRLALLFLLPFLLHPLAAQTETLPVPVEIPGAEVAFHVAEGIYSGSQPEGEAFFAALGKLGVTTIVSVDGGKPDIEAAKRHGISYIHLPFGYDGIPRDRVVELARMKEQVKGPIYFHCHHGKHRGPAAVGVFCLATGTWSKEQAEQWLKQAGTSPDYPGLYEAVRQWKAPADEELKAEMKYREMADVPDIVDRMVVVDELWEILKEFAEGPADTEVTGQKALEAAVLLEEEFREMERWKENPPRPESYRELLAKSTQDTAALKELIRAETGGPALQEVMTRIAGSCKACHKDFRN